MTGKEIQQRIEERRTPDHRFISWWRREEDWRDFDLIDRFVDNIDPAEEIGGFDLHTIAEMWEQLDNVAGGRVTRDTRKGEEVIVWQRETGEEQVCPYTAESIMTIFDVETHGDNVD